MDPETNAQLEAALDAANFEDEPSYDFEQASPSSGEVEQDQPVPQPEAQVQEPESFTGLDPNSLPPEVEPYYKSLQADYTRKTQDLAAQRKQYEQLEQYGGPEYAAQAVNFLARLDQDPNYALQVHQELSNRLQAQGYTPAQAAEQSTNQIDEWLNSDDDDYEDWDYEEQAPSVPKEVTDQITELKTRLEQFEEERSIQQLQDNLSQQTMYIREQDPSLTEEDLDRIYDLGYRYDGDLIAAHKAYDEMRNKWLSGYLSKKGSVATPQVIPTGAHGEEPSEFESLNDPNLAQYVEKRLRAQGL